jgi:nucleotide-binding universal stress UspA family protein
VEAANAIDASAVVMVTRGHDGLSDVLLGSHTERVLHRCRRPVLWVPHLKH